eukprot:m51a1_g8418 hypothetical protein (320) ;mRNA; r:307881-309107
MRCCTIATVAAATALALASTAAASCSGTCADIRTSTCSSGFVSGLCPGDSNIRCCTGALCHGQCANTDDYTCSSGFQSGLCAGASNICCCSGTLTRKSGSCGGTCADINSNTCSSGFVSGRCPGASNIQCCTGTLTPSGGSGGCYATSTWPNSGAIAAFFRDTQGISDPRALAVIMGNLQQESNLNPLDCEAYGGPASSLSSCPVKRSSSGYWMTGVGLLQWSNPGNQPGRRSALLSYCSSHGLNCDTAAAQLQFLAQESEWTGSARSCFQASGKQMGSAWDNAGATSGSYWQCAARWTGWGTAGSRAQYAQQWLSRCS